MIKYLGSKKRLVPVLGQIYAHFGGVRALDLFTGTTRVAQELKNRGALVHAVDSARYSEILAGCYLVTDKMDIDQAKLERIIARLNALPGRHGYFTETFCERSRYFQPFNGERVDAIREYIETEFLGHPVYPILLTSLMEAADRVDSTTGVQMAYLKSWAPRSYKPLELRVPRLIAGKGTVQRGDASVIVDDLPNFDFAYVDPPYNQHSYYGNYHIWETLVAWDAPETYGIACKRIDCRTPQTRSIFNSKREMKNALARVIKALDVETVVISYNNEAWIPRDELVDLCASWPAVVLLSFDSKRYVGAQIGIYNPGGEKVGKVSHLRNLEYIVVAGAKKKIKALRLADFTEQSRLLEV
jgi:adenine-specific DNA-methyltransferase